MLTLMMISEAALVLLAGMFVVINKGTVRTLLFLLNSFRDSFSVTLTSTHLMHLIRH